MMGNHWSIDCHDTLQDVWKILESLKERLAANKECPERFISDINDIQTAVSTLDWDDELVNTVNSLIEESGA